MKAIFAKLLSVFFIIMFFGHFSNGCAQADSAHITYSSENIDSSDYNYHRKYEYLDINLKDETKMFKIPLPAIATNNSNPRFNFYSNYEKKINPSWAFLIYNDIYFSNNNPKSTEAFSTSFDWGIRYYFMMNDRIKKGISGNNCNGVYAGFSLVDLNQFKFTHQVFSNAGLYKINSNFYDFSRIINKTPGFEFNFGWQKRLNNFFFLDMKLTLQFQDNWQTFYKTVNYIPGSGYKAVTANIWNKSEGLYINYTIKVGFGWGWK